MQLTRNEPVEGLSIESNGKTLVVRADAAKLKPGWKGNLILDAYTERPNPPAGAKARQRQALGTVPAISIEIVASQGKPGT